MSNDTFDLTLDGLLTLFSDSRFAKIAVSTRDSFLQASPFPHAVIDEFLPRDVALSLYRNYPKPTEGLIHHNNLNTSRKLQPDTGKLSPVLRAFAAAISSREFLLFLETVTGVNCLIPDPYFFGGGAMISEDGDYLNVHQDFNWHFQLQLHRRVNILLYLTPDWSPDYRGNLELHGPEREKKEIAPNFNRLVIFATPGARHGQPVPVRAPAGVYRRVFSAFYYTSRPNDGQWEDPHFTKYDPTNFEFGTRLKSEYESRGTEY